MLINHYFSIIIVSRNAGKNIVPTLKSVFAQTYLDYEVIVKDGVSTDDTLAYIPSNERVKVYSETDCSVYDGMNQAINYATGKYLIFMNCGDFFASDDVLEKTHAFIQMGKINEVSVIYGDYNKNGRLYPQPLSMNALQLVKEGLCHQTVYFHHQLFNQYGLYDASLKICADYEFLARVFSSGVTFYHLPFVVCQYQGGGLSEDVNNLQLVRHEGNLVRKRYFSVRVRFQYHYHRLFAALIRIISSITK